MKSVSHLRPILVFLFDLIFVALAWWIAYSLRFNLQVDPAFRPGMQAGFATVLPIYGAAFYLAGLYRGIWVFASLPDLLRIARAISLAALATPLAALFILGPELWVPRAVFLLQPFVLLLLMGGSRAAYRTWKEHRLYGALIAQGKPLIVMGAGNAAAGLLRELERSTEWRVVGLLDDDPAKRGRELRGYKVLGGLDDLPGCAARYRLQHAVIAMPSASEVSRRRAANLCLRAGVSGMVMPSLSDLVGGHFSLASMRQLNLEDLLGRDPVRIDNDQINAYLRGRVVMVTGAGGSIGAELCRQIARFEPGLLVLLEQNEYALYRLLEEFHEHCPGVPITGLCGDVKDRVRVDEVLGRYQPAALFHAAAYKHVPLMEEDNAWEAVRNNVFGTWQVARAAVEAGVEHFVLVSTDKAVNPCNVMGATKRLAEMVCEALSGEQETRFTIVRFGNVLGSAGSVIPKFQAQIARGGPVTVTHPDITRYFMSIPEACQLVLQAGSMGEGGEIFVLDMGEPVRIVDLARALIRLSGHREEEIGIRYSGLRPGEKLYEELLADDEQTLPTPHPKLRMARARGVSPGFLEDLLPWLRQRRALPAAEVKRDLRQWVPEYAPMNIPVLSVAAERRRSA